MWTITYCLYKYMEWCLTVHLRCQHPSTKAAGQASCNPLYCCLQPTCKHLYTHSISAHTQYIQASTLQYATCHTCKEFQVILAIIFQQFKFTYLILFKIHNFKCLSVREMTNNKSLISCKRAIFLLKTCAECVFQLKALD